MDQHFGVSFSVKYARDLGVDPLACLEALLKDLGARRLRLMSYWDLHQPEAERYDFTLLDQQLALAKKYGASVSLCIGYRQPRYPETHQPAWALDLFRTDKAKWRAALFEYITTVVKRYKHHDSVCEWQLENEALNRNFGINGEFDRVRLSYERDLVLSLDPSRRVCMSTSNTFGIPLRRPRADAYSFSLYRVQYNYKKKQYTWSKMPVFHYKARAFTIRVLLRRPVFIHELQAEPWGPKGTHALSLTEQFKSMNATQFRKNIVFAQKTGLYPVDLWGAEWWYWLKTVINDQSLWDEAAEVFLYSIKKRVGHESKV